MRTAKAVMDFAKLMNIRVDVFTKAQYIADEAIDAGATQSIALVGKKGESLIDFAVNAEGNCVGYYTDQIGSFVKF